MNSMERLYKLMTSLGVPGAHQAYPKGGAPAPPFFIYTVDSQGEFNADDAVYAEMPRYRVQLVEKQMDAELESRMRSALMEEYGPVRTVADWLQSEHARIVSYYFTDTHPDTDA